MLCAWYNKESGHLEFKTDDYVRSGVEHKEANAALPNAEV
jgi:hypothetical protein